MTEDYDSLEGALIGAWDGRVRILACLTNQPNHIGLVGRLDHKSTLFPEGTVYVVKDIEGVYNGCYATRIEKVYE